MPRPNPPLTPASSTDIRGKEGAYGAPIIDLPPTALHDSDVADNSSAASSANGSDSSYRPASPSTLAATPRKRPGPPTGSVITKDDFALPPPPTRSRKIIQMQPQETEVRESAITTTPQRKAQAAQSKGKKKQNNDTAAGRKIARKTAHSLIERRRRSKMNEEFGVLKDMIPACKGQDMHKLSILQASIEYTRYLEQCVADLQAQGNSTTHMRPPPSLVDSTRDDEDGEEDEDEEMEDDQRTNEAPPTPAMSRSGHPGSVISLPSLSEITTGTSTSSPSIFSAGAGRHYSISSAASQPSFSPYIHSNTASPAFGPQMSHISGVPTYANAFGLGSPALKPIDSSAHMIQIMENGGQLSEKQRPSTKSSGRSEHELDQEATTALLMLNHDRRHWRAAHEPESGRSGTGMSVKDLLSG